METAEIMAGTLTVLFKQTIANIRAPPGMQDLRTCIELSRVI